MLNLDTMAPIHTVPVCDCIKCCWIWWRQCQIHLVICGITKSGRSIHLKNIAASQNYLLYCTTVYLLYFQLLGSLSHLSLYTFVYPELVCNNFTSKQGVLLKNYFFQCVRDRSGIQYQWLESGWSGQCHLVWLAGLRDHAPFHLVVVCLWVQGSV